MSKTLYTFATSERPDAYINALSHAIAHHEVTTFHVIVISEHDYKDISESKVWATNVISQISNQLSMLSKGKYLDDKTGSAIPLKSTEDIDTYERCLETINKSGTTGIVIPLNELDKQLRLYASKGQCLFDVSALKKNLLVDVVAVLLSVNFSDVYSFELHKKPQYDQRAYA